jgi:hypothetical protein
MNLVCSPLYGHQIKNSGCGVAGNEHPIQKSFPLQFQLAVIGFLCETTQKFLPIFKVVKQSQWRVKGQDHSTPG